MAIFGKKKVANQAGTAIGGAMAGYGAGYGAAPVAGAPVAGGYPVAGAPVAGGYPAPGYAPTAYGAGYSPYGYGYPAYPVQSALIPGAEPAISAALTTGALPYATVPAVPVAPTMVPGSVVPGGYPYAPTIYGGAGYNAVSPFPPTASANPGAEVFLNQSSAVALANTPAMSSFPGSEVLPLAEVTAFGIPRGTALAGTAAAARPALPNFNPETENFIRYAAASQGIHPNEFLRRVGQDPNYLNKAVHPTMRNDRSNNELLRMIAPYLSRPGIFVP